MDSHWVHGRAGYRCRHGHTSTRTKACARPKILYIREDHLLDRIRRDRGLHRPHPALSSPDPEKVTACLRTNNMVIVCDHRAWTVEAETAVYTLNPQGSGLPATAKIPAARTSRIRVGRCSRPVKTISMVIVPIGLACCRWRKSSKLGPSLSMESNSAASVRGSIVRPMA